MPEADAGALEDDGEYALSEREAFRRYKDIRRREREYFNRPTSPRRPQGFQFAAPQSGQNRIAG